MGRSAQGAQRQTPRSLKEWQKVAIANGIDIADLGLVEAKDAGPGDLFVATSKVGRTIIARMTDVGAASAPARRPGAEPEVASSPEAAASRSRWSRLRARRDR